MVRLIQFLVFGHVHEWETIYSQNIKYEKLCHLWTAARTGNCTRVLLKCKHCGNWKREYLM